MERQTEISVLRIPADGSDPCVVNLPLCKNNGNVDSGTMGIEATLKQVPDLRQYEDSINLKHCHLFTDQNEIYYIYKCISETEKKLLENRHLRFYEYTQVYGDAFIFKRSSSDGGKSLSGKTTIFDNMDEFASDFISGGKARSEASEMAEWSRDIRTNQSK